MAYPEIMSLSPRLSCSSYCLSYLQEWSLPALWICLASGWFCCLQDSSYLSVLQRSRSLLHTGASGASPHPFGHSAHARPLKVPGWLPINPCPFGYMLCATCSVHVCMWEDRAGFCPHLPRTPLFLLFFGSSLLAGGLGKKDCFSRPAYLQISPRK